MVGLCDAVPAITWASFPVFPNETVLLQGSGFNESANELTISITCLSNTLKSAVVKPLPGQTSAGALKFVIPADFPVDAYSVDVRSDPALGNQLLGTTSNTVLLNTPELWWGQGDLGNMSTATGWVRIFGRSLTSPAETIQALNKTQSASATNTAQLLSLHKAIGKAIEAGDSARIRQLASRLALVQDGALEKPVIVAASCTLLLVHEETGKQVEVKATSSDGFSAYFELAGAMGGMPLGAYNISVSNGASPFVGLEFFQSPGT
jgi:hypothetical protein